MALSPLILATRSVMMSRLLPSLLVVLGALGALGTQASREVLVALRQRSLGEAHDLLMDRATLGHADYGKHLSAEAVKELFAPAEEDLSAAENWLRSLGATAVSRHAAGGWQGWQAMAPHGHVPPPLRLIPAHVLYGLAPQAIIFWPSFQAM